MSHLSQFNAITIEQMETSEIDVRIPKVLFEDDRYAELRMDAKVLYGLLKDRLRLSAKNNWIDEEGRVYLEYSNGELQRILRCSKPTVIKAKQALVEYGLIFEQSQYTNADGQVANRIYLGNVISYNSEKYKEERRKRQEEAFLKRQNKANHPRKEFLRGEEKYLTGPVNGFDTNKNDSRKPDSSYNDTNRYQDEIPLSTLSDSEAFKLGQHGFLSAQTIQRLSLFGKEAKLLENKIYQAKRQVEKDYSYLLQNQEMIYGEIWSQELEREVEKLIFKIKTGEHEGKSIKNIPGYFYKMMVRFWKMALLIEKEQGFIALSNQSKYVKEDPEECPSLIRYYYPDKLSEQKLDQYLSALRMER